MLEHVADGSACFLQQFLPIEQNRTVFRFYQPCQKRKEGGFADGRAAEILCKYTSMRRKQRNREETDRSVLTKSSEAF